jgi:hypothetical protein
MNVLLALVFLGLSSWALAALCRRLRRQKVDATWWAAFAFLIACGVGLGIWCASSCEYPVGTQFRFGSFPIPAVIFHLEDGHWVDFPLPGAAMALVVVSNIVSTTSVATLPLWVVLRRKQTRESSRAAA